MIAGSLTVYLFAKAQSSGIRCASAVMLYPGGSNPNSQLLNGATTRVIPTPLNLPRNLYTRRNVSTFPGGLIKARTSFFWKLLAGSRTLELLLSKVITIFRLISVGIWTFQAREIVCRPSSEGCMKVDVECCTWSSFVVRKLSEYRHPTVR